MARTEPLPDFNDRALRDRYCDLILTGGVTSAIAYPGVIATLATVYRFNSIGGSSSGAGSAALAAAAEYRRRHGSPEGFRLLIERTAGVADVAGGKTGLAWLFQPERRNARLFRALVHTVGAAAGERKRNRLWGIVEAYAAIGLGAFTASLLVVELLAWPAFVARPEPFVLRALVVTVVALLVAFALDIRRLADNDYGLCSGMPPERPEPQGPFRRLSIRWRAGTTGSVADEPQGPPLTLWLHELIQEIAGRRADDAPLDFDDLLHAPGSPRETLGDASAAGAKSIQLQMFTANVTHGRPYLLPQEDGDGAAGSVDDPPLYFCPSELRRLFPCSVVDHMMRDASRRFRAHPSPALVGDIAMHGVGRWWKQLRFQPLWRPDAEGIWLLPRKGLPIVVASRMSVSFPVLFSAVPLWTLERDDTDTPIFRRCLFSDGGICSNFPIHLFDSPIPAWPTFGIALQESKEGGAKAWTWPDAERHQAVQDAVTLPNDHRESPAERVREVDPNHGAFQRLFHFFAALLSTTKDWNDKTLARLPGVRDRVANVALPDGIGGLNILMSPEQIRYLADLGAEAGRKLLEKFFKASTSTGTARGWDEHRWVRFNVLESALSRALAGLTRSAAQARYAKPLGEHIRNAMTEPPLQKAAERPVAGQDPRDLSRRWPANGTASATAVPDRPLHAAQAAALEGALLALVEAERALARPATEQPQRPGPVSSLRMRPPL